MRLGELALRWGLLEEKELRHCLEAQHGLRRSNVHLRIGQVMVRLNYVSSTQLAALLEVQRKIARIDRPDDERG